MFASPREITRLEECAFYHTVELPEFGVIRGHWDLRGRFDDYIGHVDVRGKRVLDIGTATGFLSFEAERRGARSVISHDMADVSEQHFVPFREKRSRHDLARWHDDYAAEIDRWKNAYWLCHRAFGSAARVFYGDICDLPESLGQFDIVIVGSVLEHLRDPLLALESISPLVGDTLVIVTPLLDSDEPIARFEARASNREQDFTWWTYSRGLYREWLAILGLQIARISSAEYWHEYGQRLERRWTIVAERAR